MINRKDSSELRTDLLYKIGLTLIPGVGDITARKLIAYCGDATNVFSEKKKNLLKIPGIGRVVANIISQQEILSRAEEEIRFIEKHSITPLFFTEEKYPKRLNHCIDAPILLYFKGNFDFNSKKILSIVGTRNATTYGKQVCKKIIEGLSGNNIAIVSGLAYGIDTCAHQYSLDNNLPTIAVLAHGLDRIYPSINKPIAQKMILNGGILSDFISKTKPDKENFPKRNRIIAGISDATLVIETASRGGALITTEIANSYNRDVFAVPGKIGEKYSEGCNHLIKNNKAMLVQSADDIIFNMGWEETNKSKTTKQLMLFSNLSEEEKLIIGLLKESQSVDVDTLYLKSNLTLSKVVSILLDLELKGAVKALPGKQYSLP